MKGNLIEKTETHIVIGFFLDFLLDDFFQEWSEGARLIMKILENFFLLSQEESDFKTLLIFES